MADTDYDVLVVGGGVGGSTAALRSAQLGFRTACIDGREHLGGTCLNVGRIPSKALLQASEMFGFAAEGSANLGILIAGRQLDFKKMMAKKDTSVSALRKGIEFLFPTYEMDRLEGRSRIVRSGRAQVSSDRAGRPCAHVIIATGSVSASLPSIDLDQKKIVDSTGSPSLQEVPNHSVVIGAGSIGLEPGSVWRRLGARVTVIEHVDQLVPGADAAIAMALRRMLEKQGMAFRFNAEVTSGQIRGQPSKSVAQTKRRRRHAIRIPRDRKRSAWLRWASMAG